MAMKSKPETQAVLFVNLPNLVYNWKHYTKSSSAKPAAVVKVSSNLDIQGNGYGVGLVEASQALADAGCDTFFVATLGEALQLRASLANSTIYCLGGFAPGSYDAVAGAKVRPVLGSLEEAVEWCRGPAPAPYALHVDSGMNRLGLQPGALPEFAAALADGTLRKPALVMSHLAEADEPASDYNPTQLANFAAAREQLRLGDVPASLANSGGCLLGPQYHFDLLRPGYGLYGGHLHRAKANPGRPVVELYARIIEAKQVPAGAPVSYSRTERLTKDSRIATISLGYADGLLRTGSGGQDRRGTVLFFENQPCPVVGRVTMDLVMVDVSGTEAQRGDWVEVLGPNRPVDIAGDEAGTIGYEVLTSLSRRATRHYIQ